MSGLELGSRPIEPKLVWVVCSSKRETQLEMRCRGAKKHLYLHDLLGNHNDARLSRNVWSAGLGNEGTEDANMTRIISTHKTEGPSQNTQSHNHGLYPFYVLIFQHSNCQRYPSNTTHPNPHPPSGPPATQLWTQPTSKRNQSR
jgi:hypothetical protein